VFGNAGNGTGGGGPGTTDGGCFAVGSAAEQAVITKEITLTTSKPVDMFIMYDQSGSMDDQTSVGTKWEATKAALIGFVNDPQSAGVGVGIGYFPYQGGGGGGSCTQGQPGCSCFLGFLCTLDPMCIPANYSTPDVAIEPLPAVAPKIVASINAHSPGGNTPTTPALTGAANIALPWAANHPDRKTILVLATDGDPTNCAPNNTVQTISAVAQDAYQKGVQTFVIGVGSSLTSLNSIAAAGGTGQAFIVDTGAGNPTQQFIDAMNKIRETVTTVGTQTEVISTPVACEWQIPNPPPAGIAFEANKVNVEVTSGGVPSAVGAVANAGECPAVVDGWHYDDAANPTKVLVCGQTCDRIKNDTSAKVNVVFGCETKPAILR